MAKIKLPKRSPTGAVKKRARRMGRRRMRKDFGRRLMKGFGLGGVYDEQQEKSVRDFKRSLAFGALKSKLQDNVVDIIFYLKTIFESSILAFAFTGSVLTPSAAPIAANCSATVWPARDSKMDNEDPSGPP